MCFLHQMIFTDFKVEEVTKFVHNLAKFIQKGEWWLGVDNYTTLCSYETELDSFFLALSIAFQTNVYNVTPFDAKLYFIFTGLKDMLEYFKLLHEVNFLTVIQPSKALGTSLKNNLFSTTVAEHVLRFSNSDKINHSAKQCLQWIVCMVIYRINTQQIYPPLKECHLHLGPLGPHYLLEAFLTILSLDASNLHTMMQLHQKTENV